MVVVVQRNKIAVGSKGGAQHDTTNPDLSLYPDLSSYRRNPSIDLDAEKVLSLSSGKFRYTEGICSDLAAKFT
jgi:hypothetical protein